MPTVESFVPPVQGLPKLLQLLQVASEQIKVDGIPRSVVQRKEALTIAKKLVRLLEPPEETILRWGFEVRILKRTIVLAYSVTNG